MVEQTICEQLAQRARERLEENLYPKKLGQSVMMQLAELRFIELAQANGYANALEDFGCSASTGTNLSSLAAYIEKELQKTRSGEY